MPPSMPPSMSPLAPKTLMALWDQMSRTGFHSGYGAHALADHISLHPLMPSCQQCDCCACSTPQGNFPNVATWDITSVAPCTRFSGWLRDTHSGCETCNGDGVDVRLEADGSLLWSGTITSSAGSHVDFPLPTGASNFVIKVDA